MINKKTFFNDEIISTWILERMSLRKAEAVAYEAADEWCGSDETMLGAYNIMRHTSCHTSTPCSPIVHPDAGVLIFTSDKIIAFEGPHTTFIDYGQVHDMTVFSGEEDVVYNCSACLELSNGNIELFSMKGYLLDEDKNKHPGVDIKNIMKYIRAHCE